MAAPSINKQSMNVNFAQGLDTKTDPFQVMPGKFLSLVNSVFDKGGLLQKRNGYGALTALSPFVYYYLTTLNGNLTAIGKSIAAYTEGPDRWVNKGNVQPMQITTLPLIRNNLNQTQCDAAISSNGLVCTVYTEINANVSSYKYVVADSTTGQNVTAPVAIPVSTGVVTGSPRVWILGIYFIIVFTNVISSVSHLQYIAISTLNPAAGPTITNTNIATYIPTPNLSWDGVIANKNLYLAWNSTIGGQSVKIAYITDLLTLSSTVSFTNAAYIADEISVCTDNTNAIAPQIYVTFCNNAGDIYTFSVDHNLVQIFAPTVVGSGPAANIATAAMNGLCTLLVEVPGTLGYNSAIASNTIGAQTITSGGVVGTSYSIGFDIGLASKTFILNGDAYALVSHQSTYQDTYFLLNITAEATTLENPIIIAKLAYENGGGYLPAGLPNVTLHGNVAQVPYLYKDLIEPLNTLNNPQQTTSGGIYSQTGINLATFNFSNAAIDTAEIASSLHMSGGFLSQYDGYIPVEHNFFLWPEDVQCVYTETSTVTPTGTFSSGSYTVTLSSASGVSVGMSITDTSNSSYIPANTYITYLNGVVATISQATTHSSSGDNLSIQGNIAAQPVTSINTDAYYYQVTYEWSDNNGMIHRSAPSIPVPVTTAGSGTAGSITINVRALNLTAKIGNPIKICIYRWSAGQQTYYQVTRVISPLLNTASGPNYVSFVDNLSDAQIVGNSIIYTNGGVVEDVNAPATNIISLFDDRLWMVDAEDPNLLWYSKQVIEGTPVEMSDLFTFYVAPTIGSEGSTGPITALCPMDDKLIIFKANGIYYINGEGPDNTGANNDYSQPIFITSTVGCMNQNSIVFTPQGLMFQSNKGIWILGRGLDTSYIGAAVEQYNSSIVNSALAIPTTNQVRFTLNTGQTLLWDYFFQQWGTFQGIPGISSCIYDELHTYIDVNGAVFQETPGLYVDNNEPVLLSFTTSWMNLATLQGFERFYWFYFLGQYLSPHILNVGISYNYTSTIVQQSKIYPDNFSSAIPSPFGDQPAPFGSPPSLEQWKVHMRLQKCQSFQINIQEIYDPSYGVPAGAGFNMSGINMWVGIKRGTRPIRAANQVG